MTHAAFGDLPAEREPELLAHAMECAACREALAHARAVHDCVDRGIESLVAGEPSPQFATHLRRRIAQESGPLRSPWMTWAPVTACALALAAVLAIAITHKRVHDRSSPSVASAVNPISAPPGAVPASVASPRNAERTARTRDFKRSAQTRAATTTRPEIIVPRGQLAAALHLSAAINSGRVDGSQLLAARENSEKPLDVKLIEIAPLDSLAPADAAERPE